MFKWMSFKISKLNLVSVEDHSVYFGEFLLLEHQAYMLDKSVDAETRNGDMQHEKCDHRAIF